jgi:hypothetical protein
MGNPVTVHNFIAVSTSYKHLSSMKGAWPAASEHFLRLETILEARVELKIAFCGSWNPNA